MQADQVAGRDLELQAAASAFDDGQTIAPAFAISVLSSRAGETPSASAACMPMRSAFGS